MIRNGKITGCQFGVHASYSSEVKITDVDFTGNRYVGVSLGGPNTVIRGCTFANIEGWSNSAYAIGINNAGTGALIEGNIFHNLYRQKEADPKLEGEGAGVILSSGNTDVILRGNSFVNDNPLRPKNIGIWVAVNSSATIEHNLFLNFDRALEGAEATTKFNAFWLEEGPGHFAINVNKGTAAHNLIVGWDKPWNRKAIDEGTNRVIQ